MPIRDEATNIFMGVPGEELPELELTHNHDVDSYELGTAYGHVALAVDDLNPRSTSEGAGDRAREAPVPRRGGREAVLRQGSRRLQSRVA